MRFRSNSNYQQRYYQRSNKNHLNLPPFSQIGLHLGILHSNPDHELEQLHWSGAIHMPPFMQPYSQIAVKI